MHRCDCTTGHKKFKVAARLAFKAAAVGQREVVTVACQVCQDIASLAFTEAWLAELSARKESRGQRWTWTAKGRKAEPSWLTRGPKQPSWVGTTGGQGQGRIVVFRTKRRPVPAPQIVARIVAGQAARMVLSRLFRKSLRSISIAEIRTEASSFKPVTSVTDGPIPTTSGCCRTKRSEKIFVQLRRPATCRAPIGRSSWPRSASPLVGSGPLGYFTPQPKRMDPAHTHRGTNPEDDH